MEALGLKMTRRYANPLVFKVALFVTGQGANLFKVSSKMTKDAMFLRKKNNFLGLKSSGRICIID